MLIATLKLVLMTMSAKALPVNDRNGQNTNTVTVTNIKLACVVYEHFRTSTT